MTAGGTLSVRDIAFFGKVGYAMAARWTRDKNFPAPIVPVNRAIGQSARYDGRAVLEFFAACGDAKGLTKVAA